MSDSVEKTAPELKLPHVVFMANDAVVEQLIAFLESFRATNPELPLSMIPFAADIDLCTKLAPIYRFDIIEADFQRWDSLAQEFFPWALKYTKYTHRLRKLAIFDLKSAATVYVDIDTVVLRDLKFLAKPLLDGAADFICTATRNDPWVYNENYLKYAELSKALRFSDGFFAFSPRRISSDIAFETLQKFKHIYLDVRSKEVYSQPATNFIVDMLGLNVKEVFRLFHNISPQVWYAGAALSYDGEKMSSRDGKEVLFVHWAGPVDMAKDVPLKALYQRFVDGAVRRLEANGLKDLISPAAVK